MRTVSIQIPAKTFLAGEYVALKGGPTLLFSTSPSFKALIRQNPSDCLSSKLNSKISSESPFHSNSPAGKLLNENSDIFKNLSICWSNPYLVGGFGASTAEFIAAHVVLQLGVGLWGEHQHEWDLNWMLTDYRRLAKNADSIWTPSGADLVAQVIGGIAYFDYSLGKVERLQWPFSDIGFALISTGKKLPTHEHLNSLVDFSTEELSRAVKEIYSALNQADSKKFISGISAIQDSLLKNNLVSESTSQILATLRQLPLVAAKGCGALGADVICVVYQIGNEEAVIGGLAELGFQTVATHKDLTEGLKVFSSQNLQIISNEVVL